MPDHKATAPIHEEKLSLRCHEWVLILSVPSEQSPLPLVVCTKGEYVISPLDCISHNLHSLAPKEVDFAKPFQYNEGDNRMFELARRYRVAVLL